MKINSLKPKLSIKIPLVKPDLPPIHKMFEVIEDIFFRGKLTNYGKYTIELEKAVSEYIGANAIAVSSGTIGLLISLYAIKAKPNTLVIMPSFTFPACAQAVLAASCVPVFCDISSDLNISTDHLEHLLKKYRKSIIMPVHMFGYPCDVNQINYLAKKYGSKIIYDSAHAFGAKINDRKIGCFGDVEVFSMSATKPLVAGEGGIITTRNNLLYHRLKSCRNYGLNKFNIAVNRGINGKLCEINSAMALLNLKTLENRLYKRDRIATLYFKLINEKTRYIKPIIPSLKIRHTYKDFIILLNKPLSQNRNIIIQKLKYLGIESKIYFHPPLHKHHNYKDYFKESLSYTETISNCCLSIPMYSSMEKEKVHYIVNSLADIEKMIVKNSLN